MRVYFMTFQIFLRNICFSDLAHRDKKTTNALESQIKHNSVIAD